MSGACLKTNYLLNDKVMMNLMYGFGVVQISSRVLIPESLLSEWRGRHTRPDRVNISVTDVLSLVTVKILV